MTAAKVPRILGVDFDNTLADYSGPLRLAAVERDLMSAAGAATKRAIREAVRRKPDGEREWQRLQALVYGERIGQARLFPGVRRFFALCRARGTTVHIVSHKTEFAPLTERCVNLREAARDWMAGQGFFRPDGLSLCPERICFTETRAEKIEQIRRLGCSHFIDDLEETFLEPAFPDHVQRILFAPEGRPASLGGIRVVGTWDEISAYLFPDGVGPDA